MKVNTPTAQMHTAAGGYQVTVETPADPIGFVMVFAYCRPLPAATANRLIDRLIDAGEIDPTHWQATEHINTRDDS